MAICPACRTADRAPSGHTSKVLSCRSPALRPSACRGSFRTGTGRTRPPRQRRRSAPTRSPGDSSVPSHVVGIRRNEEIELRPQARGIHFELHSLHLEVGLVAASEQQIGNAGLAALVPGERRPAAFGSEGYQVLL